MRMSYSFTNFSMRGRVSGAGSPATMTADTCPLAVFELGPDVRIFIFREIDSSGSVKLDARRGIVGQRSRLLLRIHRADDL